MSGRAPLALLPKTEFSLKKFPKTKVNFLLAVVLFSAAVVVAVLGPMAISTAAEALFPSPTAAEERRAEADALRVFELADELNGGLFHRHARATDTFPDDEATYFALSSAPATTFVRGDGRLLRHAKALLQRAVADELPADETFRALAVARLLGLDVPAKAGVGAAHRVFMTHAPQLTQVYFAMQLLLGAGEFDPTVAPGNLTMHILSVLQEPTTGGFRELPGMPATMLHTWYGARLVVSCLNMSDQAALMALAGVANFVRVSHAADGGFHATPELRGSRGFVQPSPASATAQGLYIAHLAAKFGIAIDGGVVRAATEYLSACVGGVRGVAEHPTAANPSLDGAYYVAELRRLAPVESTRLRWARSLTLWIATFLLSAAATSWYADQMDHSIRHETARHGFILFTLLGAAFAVLFFVPALALPSYMAFAAYLAALYYNAQIGDDGSLSSIMSIQSGLYLVLIFGLQSAAPYVFAKADIFLVLGLWSFTSALLTAYGAGFFLGRKSARFYYSASVMAWVVSIVGTTLILFAKDMKLIYRLLTFRGERVPILVLAPVAYFILSQLGAGLGYAVYSGPAGGKLPIKKLLALFKGKQH